MSDPAAAGAAGLGLRGRAFLLAFTWIFFLVTFPGLYDLSGPGAAAYCLLPVLASGWLGGLWAGALAGVWAIPAAAGTLVLASDPDPTLLLRGGGLLAPLGLGLVGAAVGRLRDQGTLLALHRDLLRGESEARRRADTSFQGLFSEYPQPMWIEDRETGRILDVNRAACEAYGYHPAAFRELSSADLEAPATGLVAPPTLLGALPARHRRADGTELDVAVTRHQLNILSREAVVVSAIDVSDRLRAERARELQVRAAQVLAEANEANEASGRLAQAAGEVLGLDAAQVWRPGPEGEYVCATDWRRAPEGSGAEAQWAAARAYPVGIHGQARVLAFGAAADRFDSYAEATLAATALLLGTHLERRHAQDELGRAQGRLSAVVDNAPLILTAVDLEGRILVSVGNALASIGYSPGELVGNLRTDVMQDHPRLEELTRRALGGETFSSMVEIRGRTFDTHYAPTRDDTGAVTGAIMVATDITERLRAEESFRHASSHDRVTGLPNRDLLDERLRQSIDNARRTRGLVGVLVFDIDRFSQVNDSLGHAAGDALLRRVGEVTTQLLDPGDSVARIGSDEFGVIITSVGDREGLVARARSLREDLEERLAADGGAGVEVTMGGAAYPDDATQAAELVRNAEIALGTARRSQSGYLFHLPAEDQPGRESSLLGGLRQALRRDELVLHYQPKVDMATGLVTGAEALVHWNHPELGLLTADRFVPQAEQSGVIHGLTLWALEAAMRDAVIIGRERPDFTLAVNLSPRALTDSQFPDNLEDLLVKHGLQPTCLVLELTESAIMRDPDRAVALLQRLHQLGVRISVDDFGTGYSSLSYLKRLPVDELKIDRSFVADMVDDEDDGTIVMNIIELGHGLRLRVVAEGVENSSALALLREWGCDVAQGFHLSRPLPLADLQQWLRNQSAEGWWSGQGVTGFSRN
ncbi:MAG: sensor domain-containing protein [Candidatus Dormibacteria bacterium]